MTPLYTYRIIQDQDPEHADPRECDNLGTMACWHRRYRLGDEQPSLSPNEFQIALIDAKEAGFADRIAARFDRWYDTRSEREEQRYAYENAIAKAFDRYFISLPLYLYDHSGITMRCNPFSCPWDSGQVGIIYVEKSRIREEYKTRAVTKKLEEKVLSILKAEVREYDSYLTGDVWGIEILRIAPDATDTAGEPIDWETLSLPDDLSDIDEDFVTSVESVWGFLGQEWAETEAKDMLAWHVANPESDTNQLPLAA